MIIFIITRNLGELWKKPDFLQSWHFVKPKTASRNFVSFFHIITGHSWSWRLLVTKIMSPTSSEPVVIHSYDHFKVHIFIMYILIAVVWKTNYCPEKISFGRSLLKLCYEIICALVLTVTWVNRFTPQKSSVCSVKWVQMASKWFKNI